MVFFVTSRRRHTICALVTGVQTCALPILAGIGDRTHFGNANRRTWRAAASHIAVGAERRQPFGTLDSIKTTRLLYLRYGNGEIAVPLESGGNEGLQLRISEELPQADLHRPPTEQPVAHVGGGVIPTGRQGWPPGGRGYLARPPKRSKGAHQPPP